ncbi:MAG: hypothetical protein AABZ60_21190 [Planctomycetota bacterium]
MILETISFSLFRIKNIVNPLFLFKIKQNRNYASGKIMLKLLKLLLFSFFFFWAPLRSEVRIESFSPEWFLVTFSLSFSEKIFWTCADFSWRPIEMNREQNRFFLQLLMEPGRYEFKYQTLQGKWFLDPDPPPSQTGVQLIKSSDGFQGFNQCLLLSKTTNI